MIKILNKRVLIRRLSYIGGGRAFFSLVGSILSSSKNERYLCSASLFAVGQVVSSKTAEAKHNFAHLVLSPSQNELAEL